MPKVECLTQQDGGISLVGKPFPRSDIGLGWVHCDPQPDPIKIGYAYLKPDPTQKFRSIIGSGFGLDLKKIKVVWGLFLGFFLWPYFCFGVFFYTTWIHSLNQPTFWAYFCFGVFFCTTWIHSINQPTFWASFWDFSSHVCFGVFFVKSRFIP